MGKMGLIKAKIVALSERDLESIVEDLKKLYVNVFVEGPFKNTREPGFRSYLTFEIRGENYG